MTNEQYSPDHFLAEELGRLLQAVDAAGKLVFPVSTDALLNSIVEAAARIFGAAAASILLINEAEDALVFKVAYGAADHDLVGTHIPLDQGIAGYVVMSGQPIAISDVSQDARFNRDFAQSTGYVPRSILATPLLAGDRILGVMEVLDKINAPSFGMQDIELLGLFARQAALAIGQAQNLENLSQTLILSLKQLAEAHLTLPADHLLASLQTKWDFGAQGDLHILVDLLGDFNRMSTAEQDMAIKILTAVREYSHAQRQMATGARWR